MNDEIRKEVAGELGIDPDKVSDQRVLEALRGLRGRVAQSDLTVARNEAKEKLMAHAERGAISTAVADGALKDVNKADTPAACRALAASYHNSFALFEGGQIENAPLGSSESLDDPPPEGKLMSDTIAERVASYKKEHPDTTPLDAHNEVVGSLTKEERQRYESESVATQDWLKGR